MRKEHFLIKAVSMCVAAIILLSALAVPMMGIAGTGIVASAAGDTISTATTASFNTNYSGSITDSNTKDYYKFTLSNSGSISLAFNSDSICYINLKIYNGNGESVWNTTQYWNNTTQKIILNEKIDLLSGTYYFLAEKNNGNGNYSFMINYSSANESFKETQSSQNNSIATASAIYLNTKYNGQIAQNDDKDYFKFDFSNSGAISVSFISDNIYRLNLRIFNDAGENIWSTTQYWNETTQKITFSEIIDLVSGTYYFLVEKSNGTGNFNFTLNYSSADETFKETQSNLNNSIETASSISFGTKYNGQIAQNDDKDYFKFYLSNSGAISIFFNSDNMYRLNLKIYNSVGKEIWSTTQYWTETTKKITYDATVDLVSGTYYFLVEKSSGTGNFNFILNFSSANETIKETQDNQNNTIATASKIQVNSFYSGQIALNDDKDYYMFSLPGSTELSFSFSSERIRTIDLKIYNVNGEEKFSTWRDWNSTTNQILYDAVIELTAGTYYLYIGKANGTGNYSFTISDGSTAVTNYTVNYNANGGTVSPTSAVVSSGSSVTLPTPAKSYKITYNSNGGSTSSFSQSASVNCLGWSTSSGAISASYRCGTSFTPSGNTTLYAVWENSTSAQISSQKPSRSGYTFLGWSTSSSATTASYVSGSAINLNGNITLYAVWKKNPVDTVSYTLTYNANGGSYAPYSESGSTSYVVSSVEPVRNGYLFLGWSTNSSASSASFHAGDTITLTSDTTLYAVWKKNPVDTVSYTLTYNANGGSYAPYSESGSTSYVVSSVEPVRNGYLFLGWSTNSSASSASFHAGDTIALTSDTTLYAVWKIKPVVDPDPSTEVCDISISKPSDTTIEYGDSIILHMEIKGALPEGAYIEWSESNGNFDMNLSDDGLSCKITPRSSGKTVFRVTAYDEDGNVIGYASQEMTSKAGLWERIVAFFKNIFGLTRTIPALFKYVL